MLKNRGLTIGLIAAAVFMLVAALLYQVMPQPVRPTDAMVMGAVATLAALGVLFAGMMIAGKQRDVFFKRRPKR